MTEVAAERHVGFEVRTTSREAANTMALTDAMRDRGSVRLASKREVSSENGC